MNQSYHSFELLLIKDGSTDDSGFICDTYSKKDDRIRVFHKKNGGVSSARNVGLDNANGEWVFFLDSDDILPHTALEMLLSSANQNVDMVYGGICKFNEQTDNLETIAINQKREISILDSLDAFIVPRKRSSDWHRYLFNRIYRMSIIKDFDLRFFSDIHYKEDGLFVVQYLCRSTKMVACIPDIVYLYRQNENGAMGRLAMHFNPKLLTNVDAHGIILRELKRLNVSQDLIDRERNEIFQNYYWICSVMKRSNELTRHNRNLLLIKVIRSAGFVNTLRYLVLPLTIRKFK